ncbi:MAG TPA: hypothetical protein VF855_05680 [Acidimicrobiales bacterium]
MIDVMRGWTRRQWTTALWGSVLTALIIGLPTDVIPNPVFGRPVAVTWWSYPVLVVTAALGGLLLATYVRAAPAGESPAGALDITDERATRMGGVGGLLSFFAVGCPVCNKVVLVALGAAGARSWFEPFQPLLAMASIVLLAVALRSRLRSAVACPATTDQRASLTGADSRD